MATAIEQQEQDETAGKQPCSQQSGDIVCDKQFIPDFFGQKMQKIASDQNRRR